MDGAQLQRCQAGPDAPMECLTQLSLAAGKHHVEIELIRNGNTLAGARLLSLAAGRWPVGGRGNHNAVLIGAGMTRMSMRERLLQQNAFQEQWKS